ncbi:MAG: hypothetical protein IJR86_08205 [Bacteroidaceae bacterium]|nr:hypothetical protein [Bacteroidaceae bacterium]
MKAFLSIATVMLLAVPFIVMLCSDILLLNIASVFYAVGTVELFKLGAPSWMIEFYENMAREY